MKEDATNSAAGERAVTEGLGPLQRLSVVGIETLAESFCNRKKEL
jgi:hypothetical protein